MGSLMLLANLAELVSPFLAQAALTFPGFNPAMFSVDFGFIGLGTFHLRWYAISYIVGIGIAWSYALQLLKRPAMFAPATPVNKTDFDDLMFWIILAVILGGRLGYILFYMLPHQPEVLAENPMQILRIWEGGLSFHGGMLAVALVLFWFSARRKLNVLQIGDIAGAATPVVVALVRVANFVNAELYGRHTTSSLGMVFPEGYVPGSTPAAYDFAAKKWVYAGTEMARHPSQLYEAVLEGVIPMIIVSVLVWKFNALKRPGLIAGLFLILYGLGRTIAENFREPDSFVSGLPDWLTMGQLLSAPMWLGGIWLVWNALKARPSAQA
jgi:phosphatidylglycerol---prolipoprotein diacylglyceryl transferase